jgi:hypothetical protein
MARDEGEKKRSIEERKENPSTELKE